MGKIDWENMKVTVTVADSDNPNPLNPACEMTSAERERNIISIAAQILNNEK